MLQEKLLYLIVIFSLLLISRLVTAETVTLPTITIDAYELSGGRLGEEYRNESELEHEINIGTDLRSKKIDQLLDKSSLQVKKTSLHDMELSYRGGGAQTLNYYWEGTRIGGGDQTVPISLPLLAEISPSASLLSSTFDDEAIKSGALGTLHLFSSSDTGNRVALDFNSLQNTKGSLRFKQKDKGSVTEVFGVYGQEKNKYRYNNNNGTPLNTSDDFKQERRHADNNAGAIGILHHSRFLNKNVLGMKFAHTDESGELPDRLNLQSGMGDFKNTSDLLAINGNFIRVLATPINTRWGYSYQKIQRDYTPTHSSSMDSRKEADHLISLATSSFLAPNSLLSLEGEEDFSNYEKSSASQLNAKKQRHAWTLGVEQSIQKHQVSIYSKINRIDYKWDDEMMPAQLMHHSVNSLGYGLSYKIKWTQAAAHFGFSKTMRGPTWNEIFGLGGRSASNYSLQEEEFTNLDADFEITYRLGSQFSLDVTSAKIFWANVKNQIVQNHNSLGFAKSVNIGKSEQKGGDFAAQLLYRRGLGFGYSFHYLDARNREENSALSGRWVPGSYKYRNLISIFYKHERLQSQLTFERKDQMYYDSSNLLPAPKQEIVNASVAYAPLGHLGRKFVLYVENAFDSSRLDTAGNALPGRVAGAKMIYQFK